ncbi:uncharacterized protein LOC133327934 [Musca vetustissima]|uniref:uncharacterized protein LOC133327934 n=1 Tax=Musca vetustissima TaxID=27455 RepID=UPI002AB70BB0|nr:uncharacterized protein LOC133327934 [Musca vetustissima]
MNVTSAVNANNNTTSNIPSLMSSNTGGGGHVTYVVTTPQTQNFAPLLSSGQNGTVSVLLTTAAGPVVPNTTNSLATSGHVAAAPQPPTTSFIIRNTSTPQIKGQQQQQLHNQGFNTKQQLNPNNPNKSDLTKQQQQIKNNSLTNVNNMAAVAATTTATLAPGTTLLKTSLLQSNNNKSVGALPTATNLQNKINNNKPKAQQLQKSTMNNNINAASQTLLVKCDVAGGKVATPNPHTISPASLINQTVQKLPQVSLLQNSKSKQGTPAASSDMGKSASTQLIIAEISSSSSINPHEIKVGNLNAEVSLIKKPNSNNKDVLTKAQATTTIVKETNSLLKPISGSGSEVTRKREINATTTSESSEKQESFPRNQRSQSYNCNPATHAIHNSAAANERRHSEPAKLPEKAGVVEINEKTKYEDEEYLVSSGEKSDNKETNENQKPATEQREQKTEDSQDSDGDDDDVTILPVDDSFTEPIEIDDDEEEEDGVVDEDEQMKTNNITPISSPTTREKNKCNESLLCDEQVLISSSSSISNQSLEQATSSSSTRNSPKNGISNASDSMSPILKKSLTERKQQQQHHHPLQIVKEEPVMAAPTSSSSSPTNNFSAVLEMLSNFNMLNWRERLGTGRGTVMKFELNEFNLLQLHEKIPTRTKTHTAFERPVYERDTLHVRSENGEPITYYTCRRCKVRASALDFLAPEFCSFHCLKRDCRKRQREDNVSILRKKQRYSNNSSSNNNNNPPPLAYINQPKFRWSNYLKANYTSMAAPISLFLNPFPTGPNNFKIGMKLEAIDPENCALFCVCTVVDIHGYRLKLSFDGYDNSYDFWLNADSMDIFPPGWCAKTNRILQPPKGHNANKFNWQTYLNKEKAMAAPRHLFTHLNSSSLTPRNPFQIGMHLEAEDLNDTGKLCVASVADVLDDRIRIHFDGWDDCYDIIVDINSPYIHPCGWHEGRHQLVVPPDCENSAFNWQSYIRQQGSGLVASEEIFVPREPIHFKPNMKLEVVDPRNSSLIRPATVVSHKGHRVKLHLDGWPNDYCFWLEDDSPDLHPIGWCDATGHELEPPPGFQMPKQKMPCPTTGCRGIGNAKKPFMHVHATRDCCPYVPENWRIVMEKPPRLSYDEIVRTLPKSHTANKHNTQQTSQSNNQNSASQQQRLSDQQILERLQMLDSIKTHNVQHMGTQEKFAANSKELLGIPLPSNIKQEEIKCPSTTSSSLSSSSTNKKKTGDSTASPPLDIHLEIAKEFLCDYGPRLQHNYDIWQKNFTFDTTKIKRNPLTWSVSEVGVFVDLYLNCRQTAALFAQEDIDGQAFLLLQQNDLTERLGMKLGPSVKLYACILQLRTLAVSKFKTAYRKTSLQ